MSILNSSAPPLLSENPETLDDVASYFRWAAMLLLGEAIALTCWTGPLAIRMVATRGLIPDADTLRLAARLARPVFLYLIFQGPALLSGFGKLRPAFKCSPAWGRARENFKELVVGTTFLGMIPGLISYFGSGQDSTEPGPGGQTIPLAPEFFSLGTVVVAMATTIWNFGLARLFGQIAKLSFDTRAKSLCAEVRRAGIVLVAGALGFPVVLAILHHNGLATRVGGWIGLVLMGFVIYTILTMWRASRRAAAVLSQLASASPNQYGTSTRNTGTSRLVSEDPRRLLEFNFLFSWSAKVLLGEAIACVVLAWPLAVKLARGGGIDWDHDAIDFIAGPSLVLLYFVIQGPALAIGFIKLSTNPGDDDVPWSTDWGRIIKSFLRWIGGTALWAFFFACTYFTSRNGKFDALSYVVALPVFGVLTAAWHGRLAQLCGEIGALASDTRLGALCAEFRRAGLVLILELVGLPLVLAILRHSGLETRVGGILVLLVIAFVIYTILTLWRACRRAAAVLGELARSGGNFGGAAL